MRNLHGFDACVCFSLLHFCGVECISKSVFLLVCPFLFVKHALRSREIWHLFKGLRKLFCSFASTLTTWSYPKLLFHFSNSPLSSLFSLLDHCCSLSLSFCSFTNSTQLQHNDRHICWCSYIHIPAPTKKKNPAFSHPSHHTWKPLVHYPADYWGLDFFFVPSCVNQDVSWECHM